MTVHFIGAGPGAADLITLRGRDLLARCPVCLYAGSVVPRGAAGALPAGRAAGRHRAAVARRDRGGVCRGARGGAGRGAAALGRPLDLERGRRAGAPARAARHPLHADAGRAGLRGGGGGARARADDPGGGAEPGADPRLRPRLGDAGGRDAGGLRRDRGDARDPSRGACAGAGGGGADAALRRRLPGGGGGAGDLAGGAGGARHARRRSRRRWPADPIDRTAIIFVGPGLAAEGFRESALYDAGYQRRFRGRAGREPRRRRSRGWRRSCRSSSRATSGWRAPGRAASAA